MRGVAVDLVGDGAAHRQVEGIRPQQRVVRVNQRLSRAPRRRGRTGSTANPSPAWAPRVLARIGAASAAAGAGAAAATPVASSAEAVSRPNAEARHRLRRMDGFMVLLARSDADADADAVCVAMGDAGEMGAVYGVDSSNRATATEPTARWRGGGRCGRAGVGRGTGVAACAGAVPGRAAPAISTVAVASVPCRPCACSSHDMSVAPPRVRLRIDSTKSPGLLAGPGERHAELPGLRGAAMCTDRVGPVTVREPRVRSIGHGTGLRTTWMIEAPAKASIPLAGRSWGQYSLRPL